MNKNIGIAGGFILVLFILTMSSGCLDQFSFNNGSITYEAQPVKIRYNIRYGYRINCSGTGEYDIRYDCDLPEVLYGSISQQQILYEQDYETIYLANNMVLQWNINGEDNHDYELGASAAVESESSLVSDLNGKNALSIQEINTIYPNLISQYCREQSNETTTFIDPNYPSIKNTAANILNQANSNNSFILAKELFIWLKQNTAYKIHTTNINVQPASKTYQLKTGDCDDLSFLYISLCRSIGIPARFTRGYLVEETNGIISAVAHAWAEVFVGGNIGDDGWIPVECACPSSDMEVQVNQNFGVESMGHLRLFKDDGSNESINVSLSGPRISYDVGMHIDMKSFVEIDNYSVSESGELFIDKDGNRAYK